MSWQSLGLVPVSRKSAANVSVCLFVAFAMFMGAVGQVLAGAPPTQTYYVPITTDSAYQHYLDLNFTSGGGSAAQSNIITVVSVVASISNTVMYYDQWENGFDRDVANPTNVWSASNPGGTQIWGDNNPANGIPPGYAQDIINAGSVVVLMSTNVSPRNPAAIGYDGGDKLAATKPIAVTTLLWPTMAGSLLAEGCEVYDTTYYGTTFRAPVGINVTTNLSPVWFDSSRLLVMASQDGTVVQVDTNSDGSYDVTNTLAEGQGWIVPGRVKSGARVESSAPIQVQELTGMIGFNYANRWFTLYPQELWSSDFYTPVGDFSGGASPGYLFVYNAATSAVPVGCQTRYGVTFTNVPAGGWVSLNMPTNSGARLYSTNGAPFEAVVTVDTIYDWGGSLVPASLLSSVVSIGYGYGSADLSANGSPVWVTATTNTTIFVDFDGNPATGPLTDAYGNKYNTNITMVALQSVRVFDTSGDNNQTGMRIYTTNDVKIAAMWGEDPSTAGTADPYLDAGMGCIPVPVFTMKKEAQLVNDVNGNGSMDPGDGIKYTIYMNNAGLRPLTNLFVRDTIPTNTYYTANSTTLDGVPIPDNVVPPAQTVFPLDESGLNLTNIVAGSSRVVTFVVTITNPLPQGVESIVNIATSSVESVSYSAGRIAPVAVADLELFKTVDVASQYVGNAVTFSVLVTNRGPDDAAGVVVQDNLPPGLRYVSNSGGASYSTNTGLWTIGGLNAGSSTTIQVTATMLSSGVFTNMAQVWQSSTFDSDSVPGNTNAAEDDLSRVVVTALPHADLSLMKTVNTPAPTSNDVVRYTITVQNLGPNNTTGAFVTEPLTNGLSYVSNSVSIGAYVSSNGVWAVGGLAVGDSATLSIWARVTAPQGSTVTNTARVTASDLPDLVATNNQASAGIFLSTLRISKSADVSSVVPGGNIVYTIAVTNVDSQQHSGVTITDVIPPGLSYVSNSVRASLVPSLSLLDQSVSDSFSGAPAYTNNNGSTNWLAAWLEGGESDGATNGFARVTNNEAQLGSTRSLTRALNLSNATNVTFSFDYRELSATDTNVWSDGFAVAAYTNDNGSVSWGGPWTEAGGDTAQNPTSGLVVVSNSWVSMSSNSSLTRAINFRNATNASLSFSFRMPPPVETNSIHDDFNTTAFNNDDGTANWGGDWVETGDDGVAGTGQISINALAGYLRFTTRPQVNDAIRRSFIVPATCTNAVMTIPYTTAGLGAGEWLSVYVVSNGSQYLVGRYGNNVNGSGTLTTNITRYLGSTNEVLFVNDSIRWGTGTDYFRADYVYVDCYGPLLESNDIASVSVSTNGTGWEQVWAATGFVSQASVGATLDLTDYLSTNTQIRFAVTNYQDAGECFYFDNVAVTAQAPNLASADLALAEVSSNGVGWTTLMSRSGNFGGPFSTNFNISAYASTNTQVRFRVSGYADNNDVFRFDNPDVSFSRYGNNPGTTGAPPSLATGYVLDPGQVLSVTFTGKVDNPLLQTSITNMASVVSDQHPASKQATVVTSAGLTDLGITKSVNNDTPQGGSNVVYTLVVTNNGVADVTGLQVSEPMASGLTYVSNNVTTGSYNNGTGIWTVGPLAVGRSETLRITARVATNMTGMAITNSASITAMSLADSNPDNNTASAVITVFGVDLAVTKTASTTQPVAGDPVTYTIAVTNLGPNGATGVELTERLTNGLAYVSYTASQGSYTTNAGIWTVGSLGAGAQATLTLVANVATNYVGSNIVNRSFVSKVNETEVSTNNNVATATVMPIASLLAIGKRSIPSGTVNVGDLLAYVVSVTNTSSQTQTVVSVSDTLPAGLSYVSNSCVVFGPVNTNRVFKDDFAVQTYSNNAADSSGTFSTNWVESEGNGPTVGRTQVADDSGYRPNNLLYSLYFSGAGATSSNSIWRSVNLAGFTNAVLAFDYRNQGLAAGSYVYVQVSSNGFATAGTNLARLSSTAPSVYATTNLDMTRFISSNTTIRFFTTNMLATDVMWFDDVMVTSPTRVTTNVAGGAPPALASGYTLRPGEIITATFTARVNQASFTPVITNIASVSSSQMPSPRYASVTNGLSLINFVGDTTWVDVNGNGIQDGGEPGLSNVVVRLYNTNGVAVAETRSSVSGTYGFANVDPGTYSVGFSPPPGYLFATSNVGGNDAIDSDADPLTGRTGNYTGGGGSTNLTIDAGFYRPVSLGNRVWLDENRDGVQDAGEAGIPGVMVVASNTIGQVFTNWTDAHGGYLFKDLLAGTYTVTIPAANAGAGGALAGMTQSITNPVATGGDYGNVSRPYPVALAAGVENMSADFGFNWVADTNVLGNTGAGAIGDRVWIDANGNGFQDPDERGATGVVVNLYYDPDTNGVYDTLVTTTRTDGTGRYVFTNLSAGAYVVTVASTNFAAGGCLNGFTQTGDPDHFGSTGANDHSTSIPVVLAPGDVFVNVDFGYRPPAAQSGSLGGTLWIDANASGGSSQDTGEPALGGVSVNVIRDANGDGLWVPWGADGVPGTADDEPVVATELTDTNGFYRFDGLASGGYMVWVNDTAAVLAELRPTYDANGTATPSLSAVTLSAGTLTNMVQFFSYTPAEQSSGYGVVGDRIFLDRNRDGVWNPGEGLEGIAVELRDASANVIGQAITDDDGRYLFGGLVAGTYRVAVVSNSLPAGLTNSVDPDGGTLNQATVVIGGANPLVNLAQDFGYRAVSGAAGTIQGTIWNDLNANGVKTVDEASGLEGVSVDLYWDINSNGVVDATDPIAGSAITRADGTYAFTNLGVNVRYIVKVTDEAGLLGGWWHSLGAAQTATNSQPDPVAVTLTSGNPSVTWANFGYYVTPASLGNRVWRDDDKDGLQDPAEPGIYNALLTLRVIYPNGTTNWVVTTTDTSGYYRFGNLLLDEHFNGDGVGPEPLFWLTAWATPRSFVPAKLDIGTNDWVDSDNAAGVAALATKGVNDVTLNAANPSQESAGAKYDFGFEWKPTLVKLTGFGAYSQDGKVWVTWQTTEEIDTAGFYLERLVDGVYTPVNEEMIPSQFWSLGGAVYEQLDPTAVPGQTYTYRLIEQEVGGTLRYLGPWLVTVDGAVLSFEEWSRLNFGVNQVMSGVEEGADPDGDGMSNLAEFQAGTDPMDKASALRVSAIRVSGTGGLELIWMSVVNRAYTIEWSTNLAEGFMGRLGLQQATPPENRCTVPVGPDGGAVFYRIKVGP